MTDVAKMGQKPGGSGELCWELKQVLVSACTNHVILKSKPEPCEQYVCTWVQALFSAKDVDTVVPGKLNSRLLYC